MGLNGNWKVALPEEAKARGAEGLAKGALAAPTKILTATSLHNMS